MRKRRVAAGIAATIGAVALLLAACTAEQVSPTEVAMSVPLFAQGGNTDFKLGTHLTGDEEVLASAGPGDPHPRDSHAQGQMILRVSEDGSSATFRLIASNIENIHQAHIHCGRPGENGPIRMWLFPVIGPTGSALTTANGRHDGILASGTFSFGTQVCPAANVGTDMPLLAAIRAGLAYVNVHTNDFTDPPNTGPGDFPGGEIRGQLDHASTHGKN
ncbi:MAG TPA: CHRD domain-containing protein [Gemmatimonadaceae bacterium]|nr:CHRD domain-containing protein [Gemmatimonadaceae bacterium]